MLVEKTKGPGLAGPSEVVLTGQLSNLSEPLANLLRSLT